MLGRSNTALLARTILVLPAEITMIEKMTHTIILMLTIDLESAKRMSEKLSEKVYNENRCFEAYNIYSTVPPRKPDNFEDIISLYIERKKLWEK